MNTYALCTRVYLNTFTQQYDTIVTIDRLPECLRFATRYLRLPSLSPFNPRGRFGCSLSSQVYAFLSLIPNSPNELMTPAEIPQLFSFLSEKGFTVNTDITRMLNEGPVRGWVSSPDEEVSGQLICYIVSNAGTQVAPQSVIQPIQIAPTPCNSPSLTRHDNTHLGVDFRMFPPGTTTTTTVTTTTTTRVPNK